MSAVFAGCFVWNYVKEGYDNFSAYFNTYYNASTSYENGLKDVALTKQAYEVDLISGTHPAPFVISPAARQDFDIAIAKASKVLQLHPHSEFTEDCLFLIGISYYYEGDNLRGERKFLEIESTFPETKRLAEAEMYYGAFQLNGTNVETGRGRLLNAIQIAKTDENDRIVAKSCDILSDYYLKNGDTLSAAAYLDTASAFSSGDRAAIYACRAGNLLSNVRDYQGSLKEYMRAKDQARDIKIKFYSVYFLARAQRLLGKYYSALQGLNDVRTDDKYFDFFPLIDYQNAAVFYDSGAVSKAVAAFQKIDTANASSEAATRSAYRLANIYLYLVGDFQAALKYYQRVLSHPKVYSVSDRAQIMATTLQDYFVDSYKVLLGDSLYKNAVAAVERRDTTVKYTPAMLDTLYEHAASAHQALAGLYMFRLHLADSAISAYKTVVRDFPKSKEYPSVLYTLGEYYYSMGDTAEGKKYLEELVTQYAGSTYAVSASSLLGIPPPVYVDSSQAEYSEATTLTEKGDYAAAVDTLQEILRRTKSRVAPQALYTIGWLYENKLRILDSAYAYYKELSIKFPMSKYSSNVMLAVTGYEAAARDSALARKRISDSIAAALSIKEKVDSTAAGLPVKEKIDSTAHPEKDLLAPEQKVGMQKPQSNLPQDSLNAVKERRKEILKRVK